MAIRKNRLTLIIEDENLKAFFNGFIEVIASYVLVPELEGEELIGFIYFLPCVLDGYK